MGKRGETTSYTQNSFEEFYSKKLNEVRGKLRDVLYGDAPFVVGQEYACTKCQGRIKLHSLFGNWYCARCAIQPGEPSPRWSKETRARVVEIMASYPDPQRCLEEWQPPKHEPMRNVNNDAVAFGSRVEEARQNLGWSQEELAAKIVKRDGNNISRSTINMVERGMQNCSLHVREQLESVLGLKEGIAQG